MRIKLLLLLVFSVTICAAKNNVLSNVVMKNGTVIENAEINLPKSWDKEVTLKLMEKNKK